MRPDYYLTLYTKINSKRITYLNVRPETTKPQAVCSLTLALVSFWICLLRQGKTKAKINKWDYIKLKSFCTVKETKRQPTKWEKICANHIPSKGLISKISICKEIIQLNNNQKKKKTPIEKWAGEFAGGLVVRIRRFHCHGPGSSLVRELRSRKLHRVAKRKKENRKKKNGQRI